MAEKLFLEISISIYSWANSIWQSSNGVWICADGALSSYVILKSFTLICVTTDWENEVSVFSFLSLGCKVEIVAKYNFQPWQDHRYEFQLSYTKYWVIGSIIKQDKTAQELKNKRWAVLYATKTDLRSFMSSESCCPNFRLGAWTWVLPVTADLSWLTMLCIAGAMDTASRNGDRKG